MSADRSQLSENRFRFSISLGLQVVSKTCFMLFCQPDIGAADASICATDLYTHIFKYFTNTKFAVEVPWFTLPQL
jgi:hypothetical protein